MRFVSTALPGILLVESGLIDRYRPGFDAGVHWNAAQFAIE
jgi:hypothetical protein